jgi:hypothetical protein
MYLTVNRGFDFKINEEDCRYGFRKLLEVCNNREDRFNAGKFKYRCMRWRMWAVNTGRSRGQSRVVGYLAMHVLYLTCNDV